VATRHYNISGELTQELLAAGDDVKVTSISLANVHKLKPVSIDLFIQKGVNGRFYFFKNLDLPAGVSYIYNTSFNNKVNEFGLYIKLTEADTFTLTGSINPTGTNTTVPGTNTLFLSELTVGDEIVVSSETRVIASITNNTTATVTAAWGSDLADDTSPDCNPVGLVDVIIN